MYIRSLGLILLSSAVLQAQRKASYAPIFDQSVQMLYEFCIGNPSTNNCSADDPFGHPDYGPNQSSYNRQTIINEAVETAYRKGIRSLDVEFMSSPSTQPNRVVPPTTAEQSYNYAQTEMGLKWILAANRLNTSSLTLNSSGVRDPMRLRIRVRINRNSVTSNYFRTGKNGTSPSSPAPLVIYEENAHGAGENQLDFGTTAVRDYISGYTRHVLDGVMSVRHANTPIEYVFPWFDNHGESCMWPTDNVSLTSYSNARYPGAGATFPSKVNYFKNKQATLRDLYVRFANAVSGYAYQGVAQNLKPAVIFQAHMLDGRLRGAFDLVSLLKGTGMKYIYHTQPPLFFGQSIRHVAVTASAAHHLGIAFGTEFSWAHFPGNPAGCAGESGANLCWDASYLRTSDDIYADMFYFQALSAFRYGAAGMNYANWTGHDIILPPDAQKWDNVIGKPDPASWNSTHLTRAGSATVPPGLFTYSTWPAPGKAIYLSTLGRIHCEENRTCNAGTYQGWFDSFSLPYMNERVEILTDQMIKDMTLNTLVGRYSKICIPYETSFYTDPTVSSKLYAYWSAKGQAGIWVQTYSGSPPRQDPYPWWATTNLNFTSF